LKALESSPKEYGLGSLRYDLWKLRAKGLIEKLPHSRRYRIPREGYRHVLPYPREICDRLVATIVVDVVGSRLGAEQQVVPNVLFDEIISIMAANHLVIDNYHNVQQDILETFVDRGQLRQLAQPTVLPNGRRIPGLKLDHPRLLALMHALVRFCHIAAQNTFSTAEIYADTCGGGRSDCRKARPGQRRAGAGNQPVCVPFR